MKVITTSNLYYDNNDFYDDGRTYSGIKETETQYMVGSNQAVLIDPTRPTSSTEPLVRATTQIYPNLETDNYYPNRRQNDN